MMLLRQAMLAGISVLLLALGLKIASYAMSTKDDKKFEFNFRK